MTQNTSSAVMQQRSEPHEQWRPIDGWTGYEVSDQGRVRSWKQRSKGRVWVPDYSCEPRILKHDARNGYPSVLLCDKQNGRKWEGIHRLVLQAFCGPAPDGFHGAHGDGDTENNRLSNLRWASPSDNNADKLMHGTHQSGEKIGTSKLVEAEVQEIRALRNEGETVKAIAARYGVCRNTITNITFGHYWKGV